MTYVTYFMAAPAEGKELSLHHLETLATDLLQEGWVRFPATIFVGGVAFGPRYTDKEEDQGEQSWEGFDAFYRLVAPNFIVPNDPDVMADMAITKRCAKDLIWYDGANKDAYMEALRRVPLGKQNVCLCFAGTGSRADRLIKAAIYFLARPAFIDFVEPLGYDASRVIHRGVTFFFAMRGSFADLANNPLKPVLERAFGTDLEMAQTS